MNQNTDEISPNERKENGKELTQHIIKPEEVRKKLS